MQNKILLYLFCFFTCIVIILGCNRQDFITESFIAMDTFFSLSIPEENDKEALKIQTLIKDLESKLDVNKESSDISQINQHSGQETTVDKRTFEIIKLAKKYSRETEGAFDPTTEVINELWDFNKGIIPMDEDIRKKLPLVDYRCISLNNHNHSIKLTKPDMKVSTGAIAKGYSVKEELKVLREAGIENALISAGGNVFALGSKQNGTPWRIAIKHPRNKNKILGYVELSNIGIDTSGDYERSFKKNNRVYHHILNPKTGVSDSDLASVSVISNNPTLSDAFATGLFVMGKDKTIEFSKKRDDYEVILVDKDLNVYVSKGAAKIFKPKDVKIKIF